MHTASPGRLWPKRDGIVCPSAKASASVPGPAPMQSWATYDHDWHYQQRRGYGREEQDAVDVEVSKKPRFRRAAPYSRSERFIRAAWHHAWGGGRMWQAHNGAGLDHSHAPYHGQRVRVCSWREGLCVCACVCVRACVCAVVGRRGTTEGRMYGTKADAPARTRFAELKVCAQHRYHSVATKPSLRGTPRQAIARSWQPGAQRSWHPRRWTHLRSQWRDSRRSPAGRALT